MEMGLVSLSVSADMLLGIHRPTSVIELDLEPLAACQGEYTLSFSTPCAVLALDASSESNSDIRFTLSILNG